MSDLIYCQCALCKHMREVYSMFKKEYFKNKSIEDIVEELREDV